MVGGEWWMVAKVVVMICNIYTRVWTGLSVSDDFQLRIAFDGEVEGIACVFLDEDVERAHLMWLFSILSPKTGIDKIGQDKTNLLLIDPKSSKTRRKRSTSRMC